MRQERVAEASNAWIWVPAAATRTETDEYLLVRFPDWFENPLVLLAFEPLRSAETVVAEVLDRARAYDVPELVWWVKLGAPAGLDEHLVVHGGVLDETLDVLAADLTTGAPDLGAHRTELRWTTDAATLRDSYSVLTSVFGGDAPPDEQLRAESEQAALTVERGEGGGVVAYVDGAPAGTGGVTVAGGVTRLWSGSVTQQHRGRGVYRALLDARLRYGIDQGSTMALVKGRVETSGPILRRAGFAAYGQERSYRIRL